MADIKDEVRELLEGKVDEVFEKLQRKYNVALGYPEPWVANKIDELIAELATWIADMVVTQTEDKYARRDDNVGEACDDGKCCEALDMVSDMEKYLNKLKADGVNMNKLTAGNKLARQFPGASQSDIAKVVKKCKIKESKCNEDDQPDEAQKYADRVARSLEILARALRRGEISGAIDRLNKILETANNTLAQCEEE